MLEVSDLMWIIIILYTLGFYATYQFIVEKKQSDLFKTDHILAFIVLLFTWPIVIAGLIIMKIIK